MPPTKCVYRIEKRRNVHSKNGEEWALIVGLDEKPPWTIKTWNTQPLVKQVDEVMTIVLRSFELYHKHMYIPPFKMETIEWT